MKFAALGWYGHDNEGDERIGWCLKKFLESKGHTLDLIDPFTKDFFKINSYDFVFYGGGGLIHKSFNRCTYLLDQIKRPMGFVGISVEARDSSNELFILKMLDKAEFIHVRDDRSAKLLNYHDKVISCHDLTFLYPFEVRKEKVFKYNCGLNLRPWPYWNFSFKSKPDTYLRALHSKFSKINFEKIYPLKKFSYDDIVDVLINEFDELVHVPFYCEKTHRKPDFLYGIDAYTVRNRKDVVSKSSFDILDMAGCEVFVGMRLHSMIFATQLGLPSLNLIYQPKNFGYLKRMDLLDIGIDIFKSKKYFLEKIAFLNNNKDHIVEKMLNYREVAHVQVNESLEKIYNFIRMSK